MALAPSTAPVVEKAQHDPQEPWFLTGVTAVDLQSTEAGAASLVMWKVVVPLACLVEDLYPRSYLYS